LLGYSETSAFSRAFRRWFGVTPRQWRQHSDLVHTSRRYLARFCPDYQYPSFDVGCLGTDRIQIIGNGVRQQHAHGHSVQGALGHGNVLSDQDAVDVAEFFSQAARRLSRQGQ